MSRGTLIILLAVLLVVPAVAAETAPKAGIKPALRKSPVTQTSMDRITILSIIPAQGEPGVTVTFSGTGFSEKSIAFLGSVEIPAKLLGPKQLSFEIPRIPAGLYALFIKDADGSTSKTYNFSILPLKPVVQSISPESVPACTTTGSREVMISGKNFLEGAQVMFDGAGIRSRFYSPESIGFTVPGVRGGIHQVQVRNPEDTVSSPLALMIDSRPEISGITPGEDFVNYYELAIEGRNFLQGTVLVVDGQKISAGAAAPGNRDRLIYMNCTQLIYQRHPADPTPKTLRIQVVNPGNEESPVITLSTP